jgi:hypothetical protein
MSRKVEFVVNGKLVRARTRADIERLAVRVSPAEVVSAWRTTGTRIPAQFATAMAEREANYAVNEIDTEPSGYVSTGIFQLSDNEARAVGKMRVNLVTLAGSVAVFVPLMEGFLARLIAAAKLPAGEPLPPDIWAYLGLAHNEGMGRAETGKGALGTIARYGMDWAAYKRRNPAARIVSGGYGDTMITGGRAFTEGMVA